MCKCGWAVNYCYSFERLGYQRREKDQVVPKVFIFVLCLFNYRIDMSMFICLEEDPLNKIKDESNQTGQEY